MEKAPPRAAPRKAPPWKVGDLAARTGVTVRALHHYDEIGLLSPSTRTPSGHRLYDRPDVERLQQVQSLRAMGMSLEDVQQALDGARLPPREIVRMQLQQLRDRIARYGRLVERLEQLDHHLDRAGAFSLAELCSLIEGIVSMEKFFTAEQLATLKQRAEGIGLAGITDVENAWATLIPQVQAAIDRGDDPASKPVQTMAARWKELVEAFTGGDAAIGASVMRMYQEEGAKVAEQVGPVPTPAMFEYIGRAWKASH